MNWFRRYVAWIDSDIGDDALSMIFAWKSPIIILSPVVFAGIFSSLFGASAKITLIAWIVGGLVTAGLFVVWAWRLIVAVPRVVRTQRKENRRHRR